MIRAFTLFAVFLFIMFQVGADITDVVQCSAAYVILVGFMKAFMVYAGNSLSESKLL